MKESYDEGVANHIGPESCAFVREDRGEALTGVRAGRVWSREIPKSRVLTLYYGWKAKLGVSVSSGKGVKPELLTKGSYFLQKPVENGGRWFKNNFLPASETGRVGGRS